MNKRSEDQKKSSDLLVFCNLLMARVDPEQLRDPDLIFIGRSLRLALRAEEWLTAAGIDYAVQIESVGRSFSHGTDGCGDLCNRGAVRLLP